MGEDVAVGVGDGAAGRIVSGLLVGVGVGLDGQSERRCSRCGRCTQHLNGRGDCGLRRSPEVRYGAGRRPCSRGSSFRCVGVAGRGCGRRRWPTVVGLGRGQIDGAAHKCPDYDCGQPFPCVSSPTAVAMSPTVSEGCTDSARRLFSPTPVGRPGAYAASLAAADAGARRRVIAIPSWSGHLCCSVGNGAGSTVPELRSGMPHVNSTACGTPKRLLVTGVEMAETVHFGCRPNPPPNVDGERDGLLPKVVEVHPTGDGFPPSGERRRWGIWVPDGSLTLLGGCATVAASRAERKAARRRCSNGDGRQAERRDSLLRSLRVSR